MHKAPIPFRAFNEQGAVRIYEHGLLPHWRQPGCTYFVTFRQADSIPMRVFLEIENERVAWLRARGIEAANAKWKRQLVRLDARERRDYERLVGQSLNQALDECHGSCVLRNPEIQQIVAGSLDYFHGTRVWTGDYVIMPNHVHVLLTPFNGYELEDILHSIKSYTANRINRAIRQAGMFWQRESYDHIVRDLEQLEAFQQYIANNPAKARLNKGAWLLSQATYTLADV